ncbi:MAG TPA: DNA-processing protein DprA [Bacteroidia bacterium]|nr:DNA-processing protein DprA [Bacteroidia bacterium]
MGFDEYLARVALTMIPGIGPVISKKLVTHCGSAEAVFREKKKHLEVIQGIGTITAKLLVNASCHQRAEEELRRIEKTGIRMLYFTEKEYPSRLKHCYDSPPLLYYKGSADLNAQKIVAIIGTRSITDYGKQLTEKLVSDLQSWNPLIISGLAYGVDICAHRAALENGLDTIGVLAHGLDEIYPRVHSGTAKKMLHQGGLLTDFPCETNPDRENFPQRNRIVAGLADAVIVVESGERGGSMITTEFANNYNRDVFAFPGRVGDVCSAGCHRMIKTHKAYLIESAADVAKAMGWEDQNTTPKMVQSQMRAFTDEEEKIVAAMRGQGNVHIDEICTLSEFSSGKTSAMLLQLEFAGVVKSLPGKMFRLCG